MLSLTHSKNAEQMLKLYDNLMLTLAYKNSITQEVRAYKRQRVWSLEHNSKVATISQINRSSLYVTLPKTILLCTDMKSKYKV